MRNCSIIILKNVPLNKHKVIACLCYGSLWILFVKVVLLAWVTLLFNEICNNMKKSNE